MGTIWSLSNWLIKVYIISLQYFHGVSKVYSKQTCSIFVYPFIAPLLWQNIIKIRGFLFNIKAGSAWENIGGEVNISKNIKIFKKCICEKYNNMKNVKLNVKSIPLYTLLMLCKMAQQLTKCLTICVFVISVKEFQSVIFLMKSLQNSNHLTH